MTFLLMLLVEPALAKQPPVGPAPDRVAVAASKGFARKVKKAPEEMVPKLVERLAGDTSDPELKLRRIHDWVALNVTYDVEAFRTGERLDPSAASTLARGTAVCEGYARLLHDLAALAGLEILVVTGYGRGVSSDPLTERAPLESNHAWNAVRIGEDWRLVDVTWDAGGYLDGKYRRRYSTAFLEADPATFLHSHFPEDPQWQLVPDPVDEAGFIELPFVQPPFGAGLALVDPLGRHTVVGGEATFSIAISGELDVRGYLRRPDRTEVAGGAFADGDGKRARIRLRFPEPGDWLVDVGVLRPGAEAYAIVGTFAFTSTEGSETTLPEPYSWRPDFELVDPDGWVRGTAPRVRVRLPGVESAALIVKGVPVPMTREGNLFTSPSYDPGGAEVFVAVRVEEGWEAVLRFPPADAGPAGR